MTGPPRPPLSSSFANKPSLLLTTEENNVVFGLLGSKCQSLATSVAQLHSTEAPNHDKWLKRDCGVVCLVKDFSRKTYFIRLFNMDDQTLSWEQELYNQFQYKSPLETFHTFEGDSSVIGLCFANPNEARGFKEIMEQMLLDRQRRREMKKKQMSSANNTSSVIVNGGVGVLQNHSSNLPKASRKVSNSKKKSKLTKADIGLPTNFQHVQHVGWDPQKGFDVETVDERLIMFLNKAGVSKSQLSNRETRQFIYDFINLNGGIDAAFEDVQKTKPVAPPVPSRTPPTPVSNRSLPPVPPSRPPPPPPSRTPTSQSPRPPHPLSTSEPFPVPCDIRLSDTAPPPPPPPPPSMAPIVFPPTIGESDGSSEVQDPRTELMRAIRTGATLKPVDSEGESKKKNTITQDNRNDLLDQIRQGVELKSVAEVQKPAAGSVELVDGLAGALARALEERSRVMYSSESEGSTSDSEIWGD